MTISTVCADIACEPERIWAVMTDLQRCQWRSDLASITAIEPGKRFTENTKDGFSTTFVITEFDPCVRYAFDMDNKNLRGHWTGIFDKTPNGTHLTLTEAVSAKKAVMKPLIRMFLKTQQKTYLHDLIKALGL